MKTLYNLTLKAFTIFFMSLLFSQLNAQPQMRIQYEKAAQAYRDAASKTSCPQNKRCYLENAAYLDCLARELGSGAPRCTMQQPTCQYIDCPQDNNGNPLTPGSSSSPGMNSPETSGGQSPSSISGQTTESAIVNTAANLIGEEVEEGVMKGQFVIGVQTGLYDMTESDETKSSGSGFGVMGKLQFVRPGARVNFRGDWFVGSPSSESNTEQASVQLTQLNLNFDFNIYRKLSLATDIEYRSYDLDSQRKVFSDNFFVVSAGLSISDYSDKSFYYNLFAFYGLAGKKMSAGLELGMNRLYGVLEVKHYPAEAPVVNTPRAIQNNSLYNLTIGYRVPW